jgi:hypothetical protein
MIEDVLLHRGKIYPFPEDTAMGAVARIYTKMEAKENDTNGI